MATEPRTCLLCGRSATLPVVDTKGVMHGYLCASCDRRQRRRQWGWRRHLRRWMHTITRS
jgi:hypothetical protein